MNSIDLAEEICQEIKKFRDWAQAEGELIARKKESGDESYIPEEMYFDSKYTGDSIQIEQLLNDLYKNSVKDNFFFYDCPLQVYKNHYQSRLNNYLEEYIDANELDFIQDELIDLEKTFENRWLFDEINYYSFTRDNKSFKQTLEKKKKLLKKKEEKIENYKGLFQSNIKSDNMDSSDFSNYIAETILKYKEFSSNEAEFIAQRKDSMFSDIPAEEKEALRKRNEEFETKLIEDNKKIGELLKELYYKSAKDNFYWFDCSLQVYIENLDSNFKKYNDEFLDDNIEDFLKEEVSKFSNFNIHRNLNYKNEKVDYSSFIGFSNKVFEKSRGKKLVFLNKKLKEKNIHIDTFDSYKLRGKTTLVPKFEYKESKARKEIHTGFINNFKTNNAQEKNSNVEKGIDNYSNKIKWTGKPSQLGYLIGVLASLDYMDTPRKPNGETNYSAFARQIIEHFEIETTEGSLAKYLNIESEKAQELARKLNDNDFYIPHSKTIS